jgi:hypothetical protein
MTLRVPVAMLMTALAMTLADSDAWAGRQFSMIGAGCVPTDSAIQGDLYVTAGHGIRWKGTKTGTIRLICAVPVLSSSVRWTGYTVNYKDPDGTGTAYAISVVLRSARLGSATSTVITGTSVPSGSTCSPLTSNMSQVTDYTTFTCDFPDFVPNNQYWYWFNVTMTRTSSQLQPEFLGLTIEP